MSRYVFPRWSNKVVPLSLAFGLAPLGAAAAGGAYYYGGDKHLSVGYAPEQPIDYSHKLHAGDLGLDCRYCHNTAERAAVAALPPTETCMNCHAKVKTESPKLLGVRESFAADKPIPWVKVHKLPDYVYFDHSAHLSAGVGCSTCHGRVDQMARVEQQAPLSMGWCLDCHRDPAPYLRDPAQITKMDWAGPFKAISEGTGIAKNSGRTVTPGEAKPSRSATPPLHCSGCHR